MQERRKSNIAITVILCLPLLFIAYLFMVYTSHNATAKDIYQVKVTVPDGTEILFSDTKDIEFYLETMLDARKTENPPRDIDKEADMALVVGYRKLDKQTDYILFPSVDPKECFFLTPEGESLIIDEDSAKKLLVRRELEYIYEDLMLPKLSITASGVKHSLLPISYDWSYKKSDGEFYADTRTLIRTEVREYELYSDMINMLEFDKEPDSIKTVVYNEDNTEVYSTETADISQLSFGADMKLRIVVSAEWLNKKDATKYGSAEYEIFARYDIPAKFVISSENAKPGDVLMLNASFLGEDEEVEMETNLNTSPLIFFGSGSKRTALIPISADNATGVYSMTLRAGGRETKFDINLSALDSKVQHLTVEKTLSDAANGEFKDMLSEAFAKTSPTPYIGSGVAFFNPINADIKFAFADELFYDPSPALIHCYGNYYAVKANTSIKAAEKGKVVFAGESEITGKTIIIDHGNGIQTIYAHLANISTTNAKLNAVVQKGVTIGTSGNTGYTAENSFMFCLTVNGILVDPENALETGVVFE